MGWADGRQLFAQGAHQFHIQGMPGAIRHQVAANIMAQKRQVADQIEDLVPGRLIRIAEPIMNGPLGTEHEQVCNLRPRPQTSALKLDCLAFQQKGAAGCKLVGELLGSDRGRVPLSAQR